LRCFIFSQLHLLAPTGFPWFTACDDAHPVKKTKIKAIASSPVFGNFAIVTANWLKGKVIKKCCGFPYLPFNCSRAKEKQKQT